MKIIKLGLVAASIAMLAGCASIAGDNTRKVSVTSEPAGAGIYVDNQRYGTTPSVVTLPSNIYGGKTITLRKKGYHSTTMPVNTKFQPVALLDFLFWPTLVIDGATGNIVKIDPADRNLSTALTRA